MSRSDQEYFRQRATTEREMALKAAGPKAAAIHLQLARRYDALFNRPEQLRHLRAVA